jgi:hypothetical protein
MFRPYLHTRQSPGLAPAPAPISPEGFLEPAARVPR